MFGLESNDGDIPETTNINGNDRTEANAEDSAWNRFSLRVGETYGAEARSRLKELGGDMDAARDWLMEEFGEIKQELSEFFDDEDEGDDVEVDRRAA